MNAMPTDLCRVQHTLLDEPASFAPAGGAIAAGAADCYRVRVAQRKAQRAWSWPIWVHQG